MDSQLIHSPDLHLLTQTLASCSVGVVISDARQPDFPIIYANPAFEVLSGYPAQEILGRNCRFLQGHDRDQAGIEEIRKATALQKDVTVTLRNYRQDGTLFYNELSLSPVHDAAGTLTHYLGFQKDVTAREEVRRQLDLAQEEQRLSQQRFARIFETVPVSIMVTRLSDGHYLDVNPEFLRQTGYSREEVIGQTSLSLTLWVDPLVRNNARHTFQAQGEVRNLDVQFRTKSGEVQDTLTSVVPVTIGGEACVLTLVQDMTLEKRARETLAASEAHSRRIATELQRTLDMSLDLITTIDDAGRFVSVSAASDKILGYMPEELIGRAYIDFVHPDDQAVTTAEDASVVSGQPTTVFQNRYLHKQGQIVWLEWAAVAVPGGTAMYCVARDVTQRRAAEEDQAFLAAIVQASHNAIVGVGLDDVIRSWNMGAEQLYGYTKAEATGQPMTLISPPELHSETTRVFHQAVQGERVEAFETVRIARDGRRVPVMMTVSAIRNPQGQVIGVAKMMRDITTLQLAQRDIRLLNQTLEQQVRYVNALREIDQAIASSGDLTTSLGLILGNICQHLGADAATALTLNPHTLTLEYVATRGLHSTLLQGSAVTLTDALAGRAVLNRQAVSVPDLNMVLVATDWQEVLKREGVTSYYAAPLIAKGKVIGVIEVMRQRQFMPTEEWLETLATLLGQASVAVENAQLLQELERSNLELRLAYEETIEGWARALDLRDHETEGHSRRVTEQTVALCQQLEMPPEDLVHVRRGALLHDIGKMGVRDAVLLKPSALNDEEWTEMRKHPGYAVNLLRPIRFLRPALDIPEYHHEKWDGSGYPLGLRGTEIPVAARAFALVDVYDALTSDRPYRRAWTRERTLAHLQIGAGTHFDPDLVQIFIRMIRSQGGPEAD